MTLTWCRRPLVVVAALVVGCLAAACSVTNSAQRESGSVGSSGAAPAAIAVETTPSFLTIENRAGLPLLDIKIDLQSASGMSFSTSVPRLETGAKRDLPLGDLRGRDGTSFSPRWQRAKQVVVTATDLVGKKYELTTPWK